MRTSRLALVLSAALLPLPSALAAPSAPDPAPPDPSEPDVVGGRQAPPGKWNDAAAVLFGSQAACTGTLIAPDLVLTAGHCIGGVTSVVLGSTDWAQPGGEEIAVIQEVEHPSSWSSYDVGLLFLERPSSYEPRILATGCVLERSLRVGAPVAIVGYGATDEYGNQVTTKLMEAETTITDPDCSAVDRGCNEEVTPGGELGAGGNGIDSCFGDSGGPLYLLDPSGAYLVGVTSRGYSDSQLPCSEGGIYVRPDAVIDWIEETSGHTLPRATCNSAPEPTAELTTLEVVAGETVSTAIQPNDPDAADTHTYRVGTAPMHGDVTTDADGTVHYRAHEDYEGPDTFTVVVTDSGMPAMEGAVTFQVTVLPAEGGCGCRAGGGAGAGLTLLLGLAALAPLARRRR